MIKLHLFTGWENKTLRITPDMELGHLYDDHNNQGELVRAALQVGLALGYMQRVGGLFHFDLWNSPLLKAKKQYPVVTNGELAEDLKALTIL